MTTLASTPNRLLYADALRAIATVAVIILHVAANIIYDFVNFPRDQWWWANFYDAGTRWCVPVFIMLSGSLLLRANSLSPWGFLRKRATRILIPFLIWNAVYIGYEYSTFIINNHYLPWLEVIFRLLRGYIMYHFWFVYLILCLYLITPVLRTFVQNTTKQELRYYLILWVVINFLSGLIRVLKHYHILPEDFWVSTYVELNGMVGYIGYFILGWAMSVQAVKWSGKVLLSFLVIGFLTTFFGTFYLSHFAKAFVEMLYEYLQLPVMMMAAGIFGLVQRAFSKPDLVVPPVVSRFLADFTKLSFGIYLLHVLVLNMLNEGVFGTSVNPLSIHGEGVHPAIGVPLTALCALLICYLVIKLLSMVPVIRNWIT